MENPGTPSSSNTKMDKEAVEEVPTLVAETSDTIVNETTEVQAEVAQEPSIDEEPEQEQQHIHPNDASEHQEEPSSQHEPSFTEGGLTHDDQEPTQEEMEQPSAGQEESLVQPSAGQEDSLEQPSAGEEESLEQPSAGQGESLEQPSAGQEESLEQPSAGQEESLEQPSAGQEESLEQPSAGQEESLEQPSAGQEESLEQPSAGQEESLEQPSAGQEESLEQPSAGQEESLEQQEEPDMPQESLVAAEPIQSDDQEPTSGEIEKPSTSQEEIPEQQEKLSGDQDTVTEEQVAGHELEVTIEQHRDDRETPIPEQGQVLDKQQQTFAFEEQDLAGDMIAHSSPDERRRTKAKLSFQKTLPSDDMNNATATVKIMIVPGCHVVTTAFSICFTIGMLKEYFASQLKIPQMVIQIMFHGKLVQDTETLMDLGVRPHGTIQLEMSSTDPDSFPIKAVKPHHDYNMPDVITVKVQTDADTYQDVVVEIERLTFHKPYLGGYKHKLTGAEYHHAGTQTVPKKRPDREVEVFSRDTQTVVAKNKYQQSRNTTSTQMTKIGCYVANLTDKLIEPKQYVTADEYLARRLEAVIVIQKYYRRFSAKRHVEELRRAKQMRLEWECEEELRRKKEKEDHLKREYDRRMNPKTKEDFEILYHALEVWRLEEVERINKTYSGAERKAALYELLEQQTELIASIERYRQDANVENHKEAIQAFLDKSSQPKKWKAFDGKTTNMHTQYTIRARELRDIYTSINIKNLSIDERLDALLTLKQTVKEHDCKLTQEIVELIDREADLLMRGVQDSNLEGLRKRISTLFLQYIKTPMFNPEVARLLKVPQDPAMLSKNIYYCPGCKSYLPSTEFTLSINARTVDRCRQCNKLNNRARRREDLSNYRLLLKQLKKSEADYEDDAKIAFLLQEQDIQYLVENIWAAQSILSSWDDLFDLVMVRWNKYLEWTPWNCILLTKDEAAAHLKLSNAEQAYGVAFIRKVKHKHILAKNYFSQISHMAPFLHEDASHRKPQPNEVFL
ncbi:IQ motif and ubiquitin-like domain-containing protein [Lissotriton helveticus]